MGEELGEIIAHREVIDEAKGILMVLYGLDADSAFGILRWRSQQLNLKVHTVAAGLVRAASPDRNPPRERRSPTTT